MDDTTEDKTEQKLPRLDALDLTARVESDKEYKKRLKKSQLNLLKLQRDIINQKVPVILVFEGCDAAGKGGAIKRLSEKLDPRGYNVVPIGAPSPGELNKHYLWRFWTRLPGRGHLTIYDRSWYGRVLVERVEGFCSKPEWKRAYEEINAFEKMLVENHYVICKFWLQISKAEQLRRFKERENDPFKKWKITDEDWRNREKWDEYQKATEDMLEKCSTDWAPWTLVAAEQKEFARLLVIDTAVDAISKALPKDKKNKD
jgi:polyphosphate kinase 2 (PPK2 family)